MRDKYSLRAVFRRFVMFGKNSFPYRFFPEQLDCANERNACDLICDSIPVHLRGESSPEEESAIGDHLAVCKECADYYCFLFALMLQEGV